MINVKELMKAKRVTITYQENDIDFKFVKMFRLNFGLTQIALANLMGVTKKTVEKWEQGKNKVNGSSAVLFTLLFQLSICLQALSFLTAFSGDPPCSR